MQSGKGNALDKGEGRGIYTPITVFSWQPKDVTRLTVELFVIDVPQTLTLVGFPKMG